MKTKTDLFTSIEDDIKQFWGALSGAVRSAPSAVARRVATTTRTHFAHRIDLWDSSGDNIVEHLAGIDDFELATAAYRAACERWPGTGVAHAPVRSWRSTPDTVIPEQSDSLAMNRHAYAPNHPLRYANPSGRKVYACLRKGMWTLVKAAPGGAPTAGHRLWCRGSPLRGRISGHCQSA